MMVHFNCIDRFTWSWVFLMDLMLDSFHGPLGCGGESDVRGVLQMQPMNSGEVVVLRSDYLEGRERDFEEYSEAAAQERKF